MLCRYYKKAYSLYLLKYEEVNEELVPSLFRLPKRIKARGMTPKFHILTVVVHSICGIWMFLAFYFGAFVEQGKWTLVFTIHMVQLFKKNTDSLPPVFDKKVR